MGMWTVLEVVLLGAMLMYASVSFFTHLTKLKSSCHYGIGGVYTLFYVQSPMVEQVYLIFSNSWPVRLH